MTAYLDYWGLRERPFENICREGFYYAGRQHQEALERLLYLVRDGNMGFGLLTGEIGCGKTMTVQMMRARLQGRACQVVHMETAYDDFDEMLREILDAMHPAPIRRVRAERTPPDESRYRLVRRFREVLYERVTRLRRHLVILLDEAQQLSEETLVELKNLSNFGGCEYNDLTIVLAGQPELAETIRRLPQIDQRVGLRYHLLPLDAAEVGRYVDARMAAAGRTGGSAFTDAAKETLHAETAGIPREINRVCKLALDRAFAQGAERVEERMVSVLVEDVFRQGANAL